MALGGRERGGGERVSETQPTLFLFTTIRKPPLSSRLLHIPPPRPNGHTREHTHITRTRRDPDVADSRRTTTEHTRRQTETKGERDDRRQTTDTAPAKPVHRGTRGHHPPPARAKCSDPSGLGQTIRCAFRTHRLPLSDSAAVDGGQQRDERRRGRRRRRSSGTKVARRARARAPPRPPLGAGGVERAA